MTSQTSQQDERTEYSGAPDSTSFTSLLARIVARYQHQLSATRDMARLELKLSIRSLVLIVGLGLFALGLAGFTWLGLLGALAYGLFLAGAPVWALIGGFIVIHILMLTWLALTMKQLSREIGFKRSMKAVSHTFHSPSAHAE